MIMYSVFAGFGLDLLILIHSERLNNSCCTSCRIFLKSFDVTVTVVSSTWTLAFENLPLIVFQNRLDIW